MESNGNANCPTHSRHFTVSYAKEAGEQQMCLQFMFNFILVYLTQALSGKTELINLN